MDGQGNYRHDITQFLGFIQWRRLTDVGGQDATQETLFTVLDIRERQSTGWRSMEKFNYKLIPQCAFTTPY